MNDEFSSRIAAFSRFFAQVIAMKAYGNANNAPIIGDDKCAVKSSQNRLPVSSP